MFSVIERAPDTNDDVPDKKRVDINRDQSEVVAAKPRPTFVDLFLTCNQVKEEAEYWFWKETTFEIHDHFVNVGDLMHGSDARVRRLKFFNAPFDPWQVGGLSDMKRMHDFLTIGALEYLRLSKSVLKLYAIFDTDEWVMTWLEESQARVKVLVFHVVSDEPEHVSYTSTVISSETIVIESKREKLCIEHLGYLVRWFRAVYGQALKKLDITVQMNKGHKRSYKQCKKAVTEGMFTIKQNGNISPLIKHNQEDDQM
ncbi:hypothetical protein LTR05_008225 [Lithohypha guttulata]|uniref:Uncharacterized protein n=1 Tax=Lithohypha guttulata TaxID=1690604 RepID=A0AAN7Y8D6_9EURO|nr:hypothetical protein LTR05_008225 [Lithohypha guttulata]